MELAICFEKALNMYPFKPFPGTQNVYLVFKEHRAQVNFNAVNSIRNSENTYSILLLFLNI